MSNRALIAQSRETLAEGSKSFRFAGRFLPSASLDDAAIVYSFCRLVDDLVDEAPSPDVARADLDAVSAELRGDTPARPLIAAFSEVIDRCEIHPDAPKQLIEGMLSDLGIVRVRNDAELVQYSYRVASTVGLMMCGVIGVRDPIALPHAIDLGVAMQITNICRDVLEDARMGRTYVPEERLIAAGTSPDALVHGSADRAAVAGVVRDLLELADRYYRSADYGMRFIPFRTRFAIVVASRVYRAIGVKLRRNGCDALAGRTVVSTVSKVSWALRAAGTFLGPRVAGYGQYAEHDARLHHALAGLPGVNPARSRLITDSELIHAPMT